MRRVLAATVGLVVVLASALVAQASSLTVDAGVLQTVTMPAEIELSEQPTEYTIVGEVRRYNSGKKGEYIDTVSDPSWVWSVPAGHWYTLEWSGSLKDCGGDVPPGRVDFGTSGSLGPLQALEDSTYVACVQTGIGSDTFTLTDHGDQAPS